MLVSFVFLGVLVVTATGVIVRDYNVVNFEEISTFEEFSAKYMNLERNTFNQNVMLGVATPECWSKLDSPAFRGTQRHSGGGPLAVVSLPANQYPYPPTLLTGLKPTDCANVVFYRTGDHISQPTATTAELEHMYLNTWLAQRMRVNKLRLTNGFPYPIDLFWQEESTDPVHQGVLEPGESTVLSSFIGHIFSASSLDPLPIHEADATNEELEDGFRNLVDFMVVDGSDYVFSPINRLETCEVPAPGATTSEFVDPTRPLSCDNMYLRILDFTHSVYYAKRLGLNYVQPQFVPPVTPTGFEHRQLPAETYAWLKRYTTILLFSHVYVVGWFSFIILVVDRYALCTLLTPSRPHRTCLEIHLRHTVFFLLSSIFYCSWYDKARLQQEIVESSSGPCMNQHVAPSGVTHLTAEHKKRLSNELRDILEGWHGGPLELTSIYGIR